MVTKHEIYLDDYEETIIFYYASLEDYSQQVFLSEVHSMEETPLEFGNLKEKIKAEKAGIEILKNHGILKHGAYVQDDFLAKILHQDIKNVEMLPIEDSWNFKTMLITTPEYYIFSIWFTTA